MTTIDGLKAMLVEFHTTFNLPIARTWAEMNPDNIPLRKSLITEELAEYMKASSRIDILDALGDLTYVHIGTAITLGISPAECPNKQIMLKSNYKLTMTVPFMELLKELSKPIPCYKGLYSTLTVTYWRLNEAASMMGVTLLYLVKLIHFSNMTKLWKSVDDLPNELTATEVSGGYVVKRKTDGKVIKPSTYTPVDLSQL